MPYKFGVALPDRKIEMCLVNLELGFQIARSKCTQKEKAAQAVFSFMLERGIFPVSTERESEIVANNTKEKESIFEEGKVKFFWMNQNYNNYLRRIDHRIEMSPKEGKSRPSVSVGVVLNGINYIIPLTSQYDTNWNNQMTFKIKESQKQADDSYKDVVISCLKINNMHPALESELEYIDFEDQANEKYRRLLFAEYDYIKKNLEVVIKKAAQVYKKVTKSKLAVFVDNSVDFSKLEREYDKYDSSSTYDPPGRV